MAIRQQESELAICSVTASIVKPCVYYLNLNSYSNFTLLNRELFIDIKNRCAYNNIRRKACFSSGLTLKSDMLVNHVIDRWRTTLKSDIFTSI